MSRDSSSGCLGPKQALPVLDVTLPLVSHLALGAVTMCHSPNDGKMKKREREREYCACPVDLGGQTLSSGDSPGYLHWMGLQIQSLSRGKVTLEEPCLLCEGPLQGRREAGDSQPDRRPLSQLATDVKTSL